MRKAIIIALFCCSAFSLPLPGQENNALTRLDYVALVDRAYGQDQELVNGKQYYNSHPRAMGHPYLLEGWSHQGSVTLRGKVYNDLWLKYNIESQQVEVEYQTMNGGENQVVLVNDRIDEFYIGEYHFKRLKLEPDLMQVQFYQVLGGGRMTWYIRWEKKLVPVSGDSRFIEEYAQPKRTYLMELDGNIHAFHSAKSLIRLFPKQIQRSMKRLVRVNHLQIRSASPEQLELFIQAATNLLTEGGSG